MSALPSKACLLRFLSVYAANRQSPQGSFPVHNEEIIPYAAFPADSVLPDIAFCFSPFSCRFSAFVPQIISYARQRRALFFSALQAPQVLPAPPAPLGLKAFKPLKTFLSHGAPHTSPAAPPGPAAATGTPPATPPSPSPPTAPSAPPRWRGTARTPWHGPPDPP